LAQTALGKDASVLMQNIAAANPRVLKDPACRFAGRLEKKAQPFPQIEQCLTLIKQHKTAKADLENFEKEARAAVNSLLGSFLPETPKSVLGNPIVRKEPTEKCAAGLLSDPFQALRPATLAKQVMPTYDNDDALRLKTLDKLQDPAHDMQMRNLK